MPKGVVITHGAMAQAVYAYLHQFQLDTETTMMSFLPLAHIYEVRRGRYRCAWFCD